MKHREPMSSTMTPNKTDSLARTDARAGKYLTFQLANEEFGIRVMKVREVMGIQEITAVPQTPIHVEGGINVTGELVPVADRGPNARVRDAEYSKRTTTILPHVPG